MIFCVLVFAKRFLRIEIVKHPLKTHKKLITNNLTQINHPKARVYQAKVRST